jgi:hypothetical protein
VRRGRFRRRAVLVRIGLPLIRTIFQNHFLLDQ